MTQKDTVLVGAGPMAVAYAKVLIALGQTPLVIGRGESSAAKFEAETGLDVLRGGLTQNAAKLGAGQAAIVSTPVDQLAPNTEELLACGVKKILVEKPAGVTPEETRRIADGAEQAGADIFVAYNRRFLQSTLAAQQLILDDGGATSLRMEFSEFAHRIADLPTAAHIKNNWLYANSTHVLDLGFYLAGFPTSLMAQATGSLDWHTAGAVFVGHGQTDAGVAFSYHADWNAAPRWMVEIGTAKRTIVLQPLEAVKYRDRTGFAETQVELSGTDDTDFKPGLKLQTMHFLSASPSTALADIKTHAAHMEHVYATIKNGGNYSA